LSELQSVGMRWSLDPGLSRVGGAGPSDHKAVGFAGQVVMVPIFTRPSQTSPYEARQVGGEVWLFRDGAALGPLSLPTKPRFYALSTPDGIPYFKLATLHGSDVLATTVMQTCTRFGHRETSCQFCAIGQSLAAGKTIAQKTPVQLAAVAKAAVELDGVTQMVLTTGTPKTSDRGAKLLSEVAAAVTAAVPLAVQAQCEPPDDFAWFEQLKASGVSSLGMHLEAVTESVRQRIMPGKAEVPIAHYLQAFERAVRVFGRGEVTTYILAGLGDTHEAIVEMAARLSNMGVYPFVVPFVPIVGTPLEGHPPPSAVFMQGLLDDVASAIAEAGLSSQDASAGCGKCGACSTLKSREHARARSTANTVTPGAAHAR
jgi:radical SAM protein (TIGR04043 family)